MTTNNIQEHITRIRNIRNVSNATLGKAIGKSGSSLLRYENGQSHMNLETAMNIFEYFYKTFGDTTTIDVGRDIGIMTRNTHGQML